MDNTFIITTDATCDVPKELCDKDFYIMPMEYIMDDKVYTCAAKDSPSNKFFYDKLKEGKLATTSQINPTFADEYLRPFLQQGYDVLNISFSSGLSSTCENLKTAAKTLSEEFPDRKIYSVDSLTTTNGLGIVVAKAIALRKEGKTIDEVYETIEKLVPNMNIYFTVDDLFHLWRGGRLTKSAAIAGTIMRIKPLLYVTPEGTLRNIEKIMSKKLVFRRMAEIMKNQMDETTDYFTIGHGDNEKEAKQLAEKVVEITGISKYYILPISPIIGSHAGQGVLTVSFYGKPNYDIKAAD